MSLKRISAENQLWKTLWQSWDEQCNKFGEDFRDYANASLGAIEELAQQPQVKNAGVYGLVEGNEISCICQLNAAFLPKYTGKVLRLRHLTLSPDFDFAEDITTERYVDVLSHMFAGAVGVARDEMDCKHLKLHFRSPADREFFNQFQAYLQSHSSYNTVKMIGAWLYITL